MLLTSLRLLIAYYFITSFKTNIQRFLLQTKLQWIYFHVRGIFQRRHIKRGRAEFCRFYLSTNIFYLFVGEDLFDLC